MQIPHLLEFRGSETVTTLAAWGGSMAFNTAAFVGWPWFALVSASEHATELAFEVVCTRPLPLGLEGAAEAARSPSCAPRPVFAFVVPTVAAEWMDCEDGTCDFCITP